MRLLNVDTLRFHDFPGDDIPPYLVTSHRWTTDETSYKDVLKRRNEDTQGYRKVESFCSFARKLKSSGARRGRSSCSFIWIDTCCINQSSSAEVSESINSMWRWYSRASHCIAYLRDVRPLRAGWDAVMFDFRNSEWFERGWTLQELIAPPCVIFLTQEWEVIGRKSPANHRCPVTDVALDANISEVTGISEDVLCAFESHRDAIPKAVKMAWAANRRTTKVEDAAYCLLGIFDVHLPLIYGEGEHHARKRLEQEIVKREHELEGREHTTAGPASISAPPSQQLPQVQPVNGDELLPSSDDTCPLCSNLLREPLTTTCNHTVCEPCLIPDASTSLTIVPLEASGKAEGDAATYNFKTLMKCPICNTVDMQAPLALPNLSLARKLRERYPRTYTQQVAQLEDTSDPNSQIVTVLIGNWHRELEPDHHHWSFFVKPSRTDIIREVRIRLHESFAEPNVVCPRPPYSFHGQGWGYFTIEVLVILLPGYSWVSRNACDAPDATAGTALKLEWTLDFRSFDGRGAMGKSRIEVRKTVGAR